MKELKIDAAVSSLDKALDFVNAELESYNCPLKIKNQIDIAVEEIFVNIANYAYAPETGFAIVRMEVYGREIWLEFEDTGKPYNPLENPDPDIDVPAEQRSIGGLGVFMTKNIMDSLEYRYEDGRNIMTIKKAIVYEDRVNHTHLSYLKGRRTTENAGLTMVDLLRRQAQLGPENTALVYKDFSFDYRQFDRITDLLAAELIRLGAVRGGRIGILTGRNELAPLSVFGIMKAAAVYVPLNPSYPPERLRVMIEDAGIEQVIFEPGLENCISGFTGTIVNGRDFLASALKAPEKSGPPVDPPLPEDIMAIIYTSGSTGNPKGIMVRHKNGLDASAYNKKLLRLAPGEAVASYVSLSFIVHTSDLFPAIMAGAAIHIIADEFRLDTGRVNAYFEANHIVAVLLPSGFGNRFIIQEKNHSLRGLILGGENFMPLPELSPGYKIYNGYGCTECCGGVALGEVRPGEPRITAGKPKDNTDIYVVDEEGKIAPRGEKGELWVTGPALSAGYLNQEEKTAEVFVKNPFSDEIGYGRAYRTGDLARITEEGNIEILGRLDFQVKIGSYRIEPGEVDACVWRYPGILESVTVAVENKAGIKHLVTYVAAAGDLDSSSLRNFVSGFLPPYMVPRFVERLDKLPRNMNGKVDREALPPPSFVNEKVAAPETGMEKRLVGLWALVLGLEEEQIGREADFFELGGDSLRVIMLALEIQKVFGMDLSPAEIFKSSLLREQALVIATPRNFRAIYVYSSAGNKTPIFFVHGGNIGPEVFAPLARKLPPNQPFYCFENYNICNPGAKIRGIVPLAKQYIEFMKALPCRFPCILGGWSFGGLIAFEMALQLERIGETVEHLYLLDPSLVRGDEEKKLREKILDPGNYREYLSQDPLFERFRRLGLLNLLVENNKEVSQDMLEYVPAASYRGNATLFKATKADPLSPATPPETVEVQKRLQYMAAQKKSNGFDGYAPKLRVIGIPEIHDGFMRGEALETIASVMAEGETIH
jgi:amino acid adenylation domain-containing protein